MIPTTRTHRSSFAASLGQGIDAKPSNDRRPLPGKHSRHGASSRTQTPFRALDFAYQPYERAPIMKQSTGIERFSARTHQVAVVPRALSLDLSAGVLARAIGDWDAAAALGVDPDKSKRQLWMEKAGLAPYLEVPATAVDSGPQYWERLLRPIIAAHYTRRTGNRVRQVSSLIQHPFEPWMLARIEREVLGDENVQILECRVVGYEDAPRWKSEVPEETRIAVMHQLAVSGKRAADLAVLVCARDFRIFRVERDEDLIERIVRSEREFWKSLDLNNRLIPPIEGPSG